MTSKDLLRNEIAPLNVILGRMRECIAERKEAHINHIRAFVQDDADEPEFYAERFWDEAKDFTEAFYMFAARLTDDHNKVGFGLRDTVVSMNEHVGAMATALHDLEQWDNY